MIDANGTILPKFWGIREIMICASYLRDIQLEDLENRLPVPKLLEAFPVRDKKSDASDAADESDIAANQIFHLGYKFYLSKPKELMIFGIPYGLDNLDENWKEKKSLRQALRQRGIEFIDEEHIENVLKKGVKHTFLFWINPDRNLFDNYCSSLPIRICVPYEFASKEWNSCKYNNVARLNNDIINKLVTLLQECKAIDAVKIIAKEWCEFFCQRQDKKNVLLYSFGDVTSERLCDKKI